MCISSLPTFIHPFFNMNKMFIKKGSNSLKYPIETIRPNATIFSETRSNFNLSILGKFFLPSISLTFLDSLGYKFASVCRLEGCNVFCYINGYKSCSERA